MDLDSLGSRRDPRSPTRARSHSAHPSINGYCATYICQNGALRLACVVVVIGQGDFGYHVSPRANHYVSIMSQFAGIKCSGGVIAERNPIGLTAFARQW